MRPLLYLLLLTISWSAFSQPDPAQDSVTSVVISGKLLIANAGFAPVPAFSFNSPIAIGFLSVKKNRFSFEPDFALGLNGRPWMANNWFRFIVIRKEKLKFNTGISPILFFRNETITSGESVIQAQRNLTFEWAVDLKPYGDWTVSFIHRYNRAFDPGALSGQSLDLNSTTPKIPVSETVYLVLKPQLLYFNFIGNIDGLLASTTMSVAHRLIPLSIQCQGVQPLWTDFPGNHFKWNAGLLYTF